MKNTILLLLGVAACMCQATAAAAKENKDSLWYTAPVPMPAVSLPWAPGEERNFPDKWENQTLFVGNGRVGASCFSGTKRDFTLLNEVSLWSGGQNLPRNGANYKYGPEADKNDFGSFQPFAYLVVEYDGLGDTDSYKRSLSLSEGTVYTTFTEKKLGAPAAADTEGKKNRIEHKRSCFVSHPDNVFVYTAEADRLGGLTANIALLPFHTVSYKKLEGDVLCMQGTLKNGEQFEGRVKVQADGGSVSFVNDDKTLSVAYKGNGIGMRPTFSAEGVPYLRVAGAKSITILISLATDYKMSYKDGWKGEAPSSRNEKILAAVQGKNAKTLHDEHVADFSSLYNRMSLNLGKSDPALQKLPTNERLARYRSQPQQKDPELEALIYQYGRYMLIAGTRPGSLPLNLQGIWNNKVFAPWGSDYHNNINLQMCYWGAEVGNLSECHTTFIDFILAMEQPLHEMTQRQFGNNTRGWTTRISQNPWGGGGWEKWNPPVNAWYALHVWDHYLFTRDDEYLASVAYPILKNICHFWEDHLKELGEHGQGLVSDGKPVDVQKYPELAAIHAGALVSPNGWSHEWGPVEDGCMHDQQLIWELFDITAKAAAILKKDADWVKSLEDKKNRLVGNRIGRDGYLQEWIIDRPDKVSGHRHTSHLIGVYPGSTISLIRTPELAKAAMKSLELRGVQNDNRRSWTWPWRTALWARFHEGEKAYEMVHSLLMYNMLDNLLADHLPPMQMDGTYGITGGISEMLVQSHAGVIELLPALPAVWKDGSVRGLRARGDITIDMAWKNGKVTKLKLYTGLQNPEPVTIIKNGAKSTMVPKSRFTERKSIHKK